MAMTCEIAFKVGGTSMEYLAWMSQLFQFCVSLCLSAQLVISEKILELAITHLSEKLCKSQTKYDPTVGVNYF